MHLLEPLADLAVRRPWGIVAVASVCVAVSAVFGARVASSLKPFGFDDPSSESILAARQIGDATGYDPDRSLVALVRLGRPVGDPSARAKVERIASRLAAEPTVARVVSFYDTGEPAFVSRDRRSTYLFAFFRQLPDDEREAAARRLLGEFKGSHDVKLGGAAIAYFEVGDTVEQDLVRAEIYAFPILFLLSLWVFRGLVAALLPPLVGAATIVTAFLALRAVAAATDLSIFALNLITGLGLGLAIDWSLLTVSRFREELARASPEEAVRRTLATAGRTVLFSAVTVAVALASLLVFPQRFLYSMGIGGVLVSLVGAVVSLVVLPAVLVLLGTRVNSLAPGRWQRDALARPAEAGFWYRLSRFVMRRAGRVAALSAAALLVLGLPALGIRFTSVDAGVLPRSASARQVHDVLQQEFAPNRATPIYLAVQAPPGAEQELRAYTRRLAELPGAAAVSGPLLVGPGLWRIAVVSGEPFLSGVSQRLVRSIRALPAPFAVRVGGETAAFLDRESSLGGHLPLALGIAAAATLLVLFLLTGSVVLPVKAVVMNALTLSAAFGLLVFVFQDGRLQGFLGYSSQGALEMSQPILLFALVFGLSTDYGVFLLARIKETRDAGADDTEAVAIGLERTGRIVTAAALLFCVAVGAFATSRLVFIKELGLGTAAAVLIDASIVRALLVPSLMKLLGSWNWWAPGPLRRLHARLGLGEGGRVLEGG